MLRTKMLPSITIAGTTSGVGKTSMTLGILYKLKKMGYKVQSFKIGPDFIDPSYHSIVTKNPTYNLDSWLMGIEGVIDTFERNTKSVDLAVIEGVMGLYDGAEGKTDFASTAQIAKILKSNVILVIDASKAARSITAMAYGYILFDRKIKISGIIINKLASIKHYNFIKDSFADKINVPIIGAIYTNNNFHFKERHIGLLPSAELSINKRREVLNIAKTIADSINIDFITSMKINKLRKINHEFSPIKRKKTSVKIAVALDSSFNFYYRENLERLQEEGAKLIFFSPVNDKKIPIDISGILIGGGFPEILGKKLSENYSMLKDIKKAGESYQIPIYAECGGLMYLTKSIKELKYPIKSNEPQYVSKGKPYTKDKKDLIYQEKKTSHRMVGLLDASTEMTNRLVLNYTDAIITKNSIFAKKGRVKGHEFHFSKILNLPKDYSFAYRLVKGIGIDGAKDGILTYNILASYMHLHFSNTKYPQEIIKACKNYLKK